MKPAASLLITDLDDTIWYWFKMWHAAFRAELDELTKVTGLGEDILIAEIKKVHERHHTSEYAFLLQELPSLQVLYGGAFDPKKTLPTVIHAYRKARKQNMGLYPTVLETLLHVRKQGARIVAFTESQRYYSIQRLKTCGLDGIVDVMYATGEGESLTVAQLASSREHEESWYELQKTRVVTLPQGLKKPNPLVLKDILADESCPPTKAVYVGDTLSKDIVMASQAGVLSAHALYGETHKQPGYDLLKAVTHWTEADVKKQASATRISAEPDFVLNDNFGQLRDFVTFEAPIKT